MKKRGSEKSEKFLEKIFWKGPSEELFSENENWSEKGRFWGKN